MHRRQAMMAILLIGFSLFSIDDLAQTTSPRLVLVCGTVSTLPTLSRAEVRQVFLGAPIEKNGVRLKPLRNASDPQITEVFLQKIIFMSKQKYERQLAARVFRLGGARPKIYSNLADLVAELRRSPESVTYMSSAQLQQVQGVKSLGILWEGSEQ